MSGVNEEGDKREQKDDYSQSASYKWMKCQNLICVFFSLNLIFEMIKFLPSLSSNSLHKLIPTCLQIHDLFLKLIVIECIYT